MVRWMGMFVQNRNAGMVDSIAGGGKLAGGLRKRPTGHGGANREHGEQEGATEN